MLIIFDRSSSESILFCYIYTLSFTQLKKKNTEKTPNFVTLKAQEKNLKSCKTPETNE